MNEVKLGRQNCEEKEILNEKNDCTVRALMEGFDIPYLEAYGMAIGIGRKARKGVKVSGIRELMNTLAVKKVARPGMVVENFVKYIAYDGRWIVEIRGHVFGVVEGVIKDEYPKGNLNCHVIQAWRVR